MSKFKSRSGIIKSGVTHLVEQVINPISFESKIEEQIRELLGIEEDSLLKSEEINKHDDKLSDKLDDISDDDISGDELSEKTTDDRPNSDLGIKSEREYEELNSSRDPIHRIDALLEEIRCSNQQDTHCEESVKREKYEESISSSSISSTGELDCTD